MKRVVVIGARRTRQGIGEFVAREFHAAGAEVCAVVGSTPETAHQASAALRAHGIECRGHGCVEEALAAEGPDIVAICSPFALHRSHLEAVAAAGASCLCEKPLWWQSGVDLASGTADLVDGFLDRGLHLALITQWPFTLPGYFELFPEQRDSPLESFEMLLSPISIRSRAVLDSMPHVLSMLQARVGCGSVAHPVARYEDPDQRELTVSFEYNHAHGRVLVTGRLVTCADRPRPAAYALNGFRADRTIHLPEYSMHLEGRIAGRTRRVTIEDPLAVLVRSYLTQVESGAPESDSREQRRALIESVTLLEPLVKSMRVLEEETP